MILIATVSSITSSSLQIKKSDTERQVFNQNFAFKTKMQGVPVTFKAIGKSPKSLCNKEWPTPK